MLPEADFETMLSHPSLSYCVCVYQHGLFHSLSPVLKIPRLLFTIRTI